MYDKTIRHPSSSVDLISKGNKTKGKERKEEKEQITKTDRKTLERAI